MGWTVGRSNPGRVEIFHACPDQPWGPPSLLYNGYQGFPGGKSGRGVTLTPHPLLVPWSRKSRAIPLLPPGPYGLYRASVPVQHSYTSTPSMGRTACTEPQCLYSTAIPLLPPWAVRTVQSLSACTTVHFTFITLLFLINKYGAVNIGRTEGYWLWIVSEC